MLARRRLITAFGLLLGAAPIGLAPALGRAGSVHPAADFLDSMSKRAVAGLTDLSREEAEREAIFRSLLTEAFDLPAIARFVVGRYWRASSAEQRRALLEVVEDVVVQRFLPLFNHYQNEQFIVGVARQDENDPRRVFVAATFVNAQGTPVNTEWRLREQGDRFQIFDVVVEGVSMVITLRSEYGSVIKRMGGIDGLVRLLRDKLGRGEFAPKTAGATP